MSYSFNSSKGVYKDLYRGIFKGLLRRYRDFRPRDHTIRGCWAILSVKVKFFARILRRTVGGETLNYTTWVPETIIPNP